MHLSEKLYPSEMLPLLLEVRVTLAGEKQYLIRGVASKKVMYFWRQRQHSCPLGLKYKVEDKWKTFPSLTYPCSCLAEKKNLKSWLPKNLIFAVINLQQQQRTENAQAGFATGLKTKADTGLGLELQSLGLLPISHFSLHIC